MATGSAARLATRRFFSTDATTLARALLGATLVRRFTTGEVLRATIVETEAYVGVKDLASHAFGGRRTPRNESMYARPGTLYVYFTYGMHHCANIVCGAPGEPVAVLLRALEPVEGVEIMRANRAGRAGRVGDRLLCRGPGNLCRALAIDRSLDGVDLAGGSGAAVSVEISRRSPIEPARIVRGPRIGLGDAGAWRDKPLRFWVRGSPFVSGRTSPKTNGPRSV